MVSLSNVAIEKKPGRGEKEAETINAEGSEVLV